MRISIESAGERRNTRSSAASAQRWFYRGEKSLESSRKQPLSPHTSAERVDNETWHEIRDGAAVLQAIALYRHPRTRPLGGHFCMSVDPSWSVRPAQGGRHGVLSLRIGNRPTASEMAFDKVVISVSGRVCTVLPNAPEPTAVLDGYRDTLARRAEATRPVWSQPGAAPTRFHTKLSRPLGTVTGALLRTTWADTTHDLTLTLTINPTRTLIHALTMVDDRTFTASRLASLPLADFFAWSPIAASASTLDGTDNAFDHLDDIIARMGADHAGAFIAMFERKLKEWALEAVAPRGQGFRHDLTGGTLIGDNGVHRVSLNWSHLFLRSAEVYCERRHGGAVALMERLNAAVLAAHAEADWRMFDIGEIGGRAAGSTVIGIALTSRIRQVYYAKTADRIRIETRYHHRVRDALRGAPISVTTPLCDLLIGLREEAAARLQWASFCAMAAEPPVPMVTDFARLAGIVARCASQAKVDAAPVFAALAGSGGLEQTRASGPIPLRLIRRLVDAGLVSKVSLQARARPGQARRHHLTEPYATVARMLQRTFSPTADVETPERS